MLPLGTPLPAFDLPLVEYEHDGKGSRQTRMKKDSLEAKPVLLMVICAHCPFVKHIESQLTNLDNDYREQVQLIALSSNSLVTHPQDGPEHLAEQARLNKWHFPYLLDLKQTLAKSLMAACTPDFFLFSVDNKDEHKLCYRGQLDESRPGNDIPVTGDDLRKALDAVLSGKLLSEDQKPSIGCNIKWNPGSEPEWFG
tara:strand:- start:88 stop:678 length:591 start_codon:yes stop_codon:yes gene_type:complete